MNDNDFNDMVSNLRGAVPKENLPAYDIMANALKDYEHVLSPNLTNGQGFLYYLEKAKKNLSPDGYKCISSALTASNILLDAAYNSMNNAKYLETIAQEQGFIRGVLLVLNILEHANANRTAVPDAELEELKKIAFGG
jgi:hypothetical protein